MFSDVESSGRTSCKRYLIKHPNKNTMFFLRIRLYFIITYYFCHMKALKSPFTLSSVKVLLFFNLCALVVGIL